MTNRPLIPPEESAEDLYENAPFGYISFLKDGTIFKLNRTLLNLLNYEKEEIVGVKKIQDFFRIGGKIYFETHFFPLIKMQGFVKEINFDLVRKDKTFFPALFNVNQISDISSERVSYRASVIDISDRKKYEKVLIDNKEAAERATRVKAEFLSTISHEIRTPLNAIVGIGNLIQQTTLNDLQKEYARILQLSSRSLLELVNNLLDLSKLEAQKISMEERTFNLKDLLKVLIHSFQIKTAEKNIEIKTKFSDDLPDYINGDPVKLNQVLTNLLGNAVKFTRKGYVKLEIQVLESYDKRVVLQFIVSDTGIGIPKEKLDIIFHEFAQASYDVNLEYGGTGLGLTISQKILQMHNSELQVESEEGKGSKFSFTLNYNLPLNPPSEVSQPREANLRVNTSAKILVVDDNETNLFITSKYLEGWNLPNVTVSSGSAALEAVKQDVYDLILMDLHMPKMNGYETASMINSLELKKKPVIIALSASGRGDVNLKMKKAGMSAYLPKPFDPKELLELITDFLSVKKEKVEEVVEKPVINFSIEDHPQKLLHKDAISFNISRLIQLAKDDRVILQKLTKNSLRSIKEYKSDFNTAAESADAKKVGELIHKNSMTLHYINAGELGKLIGDYHKIIKNPGTEKEDISMKEKQVVKEFNKIINGLEALEIET